MSDGFKLSYNKQTIFQKAQSLLKAMGSVAGNDFLKRDLAVMTRDLLYKRVKSGKGVSSDRTAFIMTSHRRFAPISKNYKTYRRTGYVEFKATVKGAKGRKKKVNVSFPVGKPALGNFGSPNRSNLTMTGQMLDSMQFEIKRFGFAIVIPPTARREGGVTNAQVARWVSKDRPFLNLTAGEARIVKSRMKQTLRREFRKLLR